MDNKTAKENFEFYDFKDVSKLLSEIGRASCRERV